MEKEFYTDEFEELIREKSDQFRMYPSKRIWHSIYNDLHPSRKWPSAAMSMFLIIALLLVGHLNTSDNTVIRKNNNSIGNEISNENKNKKNSISQISTTTNTRKQQLILTNSEKAFDDNNSTKTEFLAYTIVKNNKPNYFYTSPQTNPTEGKYPTTNKTAENTAKDIIQTMDSYIKTNQIFTDIAVNNKLIKTTAAKPISKNTDKKDNIDENKIERGDFITDITTPQLPLTVQANSFEVNKLITIDENSVTKLKSTATNQNSLTLEEKSWMESYALHNGPVRNKWKDRLAVEFYVTPAVDYRKLRTETKGSSTAFANTDINSSISQKPGLGIETGVGLAYAYAKKIQLKLGAQFNYTNYNIDAAQTNHPILTTIILNDPYTGFSYLASRTSTISNVYNSSALQPTTIHNRTYQISIPIGLVYKITSHDKLDWFAGASIQPTYVFGGRANLISSDLKSYVSDPSSIRHLNLNMGLETYMNFKLGGYSLQVGPQVRYQLFSTYQKRVALIEKPYAVGLKFGIIKGM